MKNPFFYFIYMFMKSYQKFIAESVRSMMKPKSEEEILELMKGKSLEKIFFHGSQNGVLSLVELALNKGIYINKKDNSDIVSRTALIYASENGHIDIVKYLVENGADMNKEDNNFINRLMVIAMKKDITVWIMDYNTNKWKKVKQIYRYDY